MYLYISEGNISTLCMRSLLLIRISRHAVVEMVDGGTSLIRCGGLEIRPVAVSPRFAFGYTGRQVAHPNGRRTARDKTLPVTRPTK
jgi:hypothetical protein